MQHGTPWIFRRVCHVICICSFRRTKPQLGVILSLNKSGLFATTPLLQAVGSVPQILTTISCGS
jgi:hypothetical protein